MEWLPWAFTALILGISTAWVFLQRQDAINSINALGKTLSEQIDKERVACEERIQREWERARSEVQIEKNINLEMSRYITTIKIQAQAPQAPAKAPQPAQVNGASRPPLTLEPDNMDT